MFTLLWGLGEKKFIQDIGEMVLLLLHFPLFLQASHGEEGKGFIGKWVD